MLFTIFTLLVAYQLKHFFADYPLQRPWMLGKFLPGWQFVVPLAAHCAVHGIMTCTIAYVFSGSLWLALGLAALDFTVHFLMDRIKASPKWMGRWKPLTAKDYMQAQKTVSGDGCPRREYDCGDVRCDVHHANCTRDYGAECWHADAFETAGARRKLRSNRLFWDALGFDQMVHHLTHYLIIFLLIRYS